MPFAKLRFDIIVDVILGCTILGCPILGCTILGCTRAAWAQSPFTLEQVMSSSFPSELVASKNGSRIAWVFDAKGVRNVWLADGPDFVHTARPLTHYKTDDGHPIPPLRPPPDANTVLYALATC